MLLEKLKQKSLSIDDRIGRDELMKLVTEDNVQEIEDILIGVHIVEYLLKDNIRTLLSFYNSDIPLKNIDGIDNVLQTFKWFIEDQEPSFLREKARLNKSSKEVSESLKPSKLCEIMSINYNNLCNEIIALYYIRFDTLIHELTNNIIKYRKIKNLKAINYKDIVDELNDVYEVYFFNDNSKSNVDIAQLRQFYFMHESNEKSKRLKQTQKNRLKKRNKMILKYIQDHHSGLNCLCFTSDISIDMSTIL